MTLSSESESEETAIRVRLNPSSDQFFNLKERHQAIYIIILQLLVSIPWRLYTMSVSKGVLDAIHITEELDFRCTYGADALKMLQSRTGIINNVDMARKSDLNDVCALQYQAYSKIYAYMGIPREKGPSFMQSQWRSRGKAVMKKFLGRVGLVRDTTGRTVSALYLQLPGDVAALESCPADSTDSIDDNWLITFPGSTPLTSTIPIPSVNESSQTQTARDRNAPSDSPNPLPSASVSASASPYPYPEPSPTPSSPSPDRDRTHFTQSITNIIETVATFIANLILSIIFMRINWTRLGLYDPVAKLGPIPYIFYRLRYVILSDHTCAPGEAYIEFISTCENARSLGAGTKLLKWAEQSAEALGCGRITLTVEGDNVKAKALFERLGYKVTRNSTDIFSICWFYLLFGTKKGFYEMEKPLGQEQGFAVYSNFFGFTAQKLDSLSRHGSLHSALGLLNSQTLSDGTVHQSNNHALRYFGQNDHDNDTGSVKNNADHENRSVEEGEAHGVQRNRQSCGLRGREEVEDVCSNSTNNLGLNSNQNGHSNNGYINELSTSNGRHVDPQVESVSSESQSQQTAGSGKTKISTATADCLFTGQLVGMKATRKSYLKTYVSGTSSSNTSSLSRGAATNERRSAPKTSSPGSVISNDSEVSVYQESRSDSKKKNSTSVSMTKKS